MRTALRAALLGWALIIVGAITDPLQDTRAIGTVALPLAAGLVGYVLVSVLEPLDVVVARCSNRARRRTAVVLQLSAALGAGVFAGVAVGGLLGGFGLESGVMCAGGLLTVLAVDVLA